MSLELRAPMASILGSTPEMLQEELDDPTAMLAPAPSSTASSGTVSGCC